MARKYTNKLLDMVDEGLLDKDNVIRAMAMYLSDDDVGDMMRSNEFYDNEDEYEDEDSDD